MGRSPYGVARYTKHVGFSPVFSKPFRSAVEISLRSTLIVPSQREALDRVLHWAECFRGKSAVNVFASEPFPKEVWLRYQVALAEGFTNVVRHAHEQLPLETPVELEMQIEGTRIVLKIWDLGPPFDLLGKLQERLEQPRPKTLATGGYGLVIMYRAADELRYEREAGDRNCLTLVWNLSE